MSPRIDRHDCWTVGGALVVVLVVVVGFLVFVHAMMGPLAF